MDFSEGFRISKHAIWFVTVAMLFSTFIGVSYYFVGTGPIPIPVNTSNSVEADSGNKELARILEEAATPDKTIILTNVNNAWVAPDSVFDLFRESMRIGNNTERLLKHLVVVSFDDKAYSRCLGMKLHCYLLQAKDSNFSGEAAGFMTPSYLEIVWRKIDFLHSVLSLGYNFLFSDTDIMWFRDPFPHLQDAVDIQVSCDYYNGNPTDMNNSPNTGVMYVKSNRRTILFYELWYNSRHQYEGWHDQDVFNVIRVCLFKILGLKIKFLDTTLFGGFCQPSQDVNQVCTMHANCCVGLEHKVHDLKLVLGDWTKYLSASPHENMTHPFIWSAPKQCFV